MAEVRETQPLSVQLLQKSGSMSVLHSDLKVKMGITPAKGEGF